MARRPVAHTNAREAIFGPPATTPDGAFVRFGNACHWASAGLHRERPSSPEALVEAGLRQMARAEHRLVAEFVTELTSGAYTFAEADAIWQRSQNDTTWMCWDDAAGYLRFLRIVRDTIDPNAWPAAAPRFRPDSIPGRRKRSR